MKLNKDLIIEMAKISAADAELRLAEWNEYGTLNPKYENYDQTVVSNMIDSGEYFDIDNMEGWTGEINGRLFIIPRGADSLTDWIKAVFLSKKVVPYIKSGTNKEIKVHKGFLDNYLRIRDYIHKKVKESNLDTIVLYGHSMGAAIATLCALDLKYNFKDREVGIFITGSPRIGNEAFKKSFEKYMPDFAQVEYGSDLITQIILKILGFRHLKNMIHVGPKRRKGLGTKKDHNWWLYIDAMEEELTDDFLESL